MSLKNTIEFKEKIFNEYQSGQEVKVLAKKYKVSKNYIYLLIRNDFANIENKTLTEEEIEQLIYDNIKGLDQSELATKYKIPYSSVRYYIKKYKEEKKQEKENEIISDETTQKILSDFDKNIDFEKIAKKYNVDLNLVYDIYENKVFSNKQYNKYKDKISLLYHQGQYSIKDIAAAYSIHYGVLLSKLKLVEKQDIIQDRKSGLSVDELVELYKPKKKDDETEDDLKLRTKQYIKKILHKNIEEE